MQKTLLSVLAIALLVAPMATAESASDSSSDFLFVTFELGEVVAKTSFNGVFRASFGNSTTASSVAAHPGQLVQGSLSLPVNTTSGNWNISLVDADDRVMLAATGVVSSDRIQILGSTVDSDRLDLPRDSTSVRIVKGYVSATLTLIGQLKTPDCCRATLGIDANADGDITENETRTVHANGTEVRASIQLERAAPSVPYIFTVTEDGGKVVARASGTYSFTKLNGVSANGEFDPNVVEYVTGNVERVPHLLKHDIPSSLLLQTVAGSAREEEGPKVFFTMGTPDAGAKSEAEAESTQGNELDAASTAADDPASRGLAGAVQWFMGIFTGTAFLAILLGSLLAAVLGVAAKNLMERRE